MVVSLPFSPLPLILSFHPTGKSHDLVDHSSNIIYAGLNILKTQEMKGKGREIDIS